LLNYEKALKAYKDKNFPLAQSFLTASLQSVKNDSYKPYLLEALLLLKNEKYEESLKFAKKSYNLKKNAQTACVLGNSYYLNGKYEKSVKILEKNKTEKCLDILAFDYYKLKNYEKAQKYLLEVLEKNPKNKKALKYLIKILKAKKERFLLNIFENQYKGLK
jgi:tetratricopeptide (TPR) repeat protein